MPDLTDWHLEAHEIAAYVDHGVSGARRAAIETHLASCTTCRAELTEVTRILRAAHTPGRVSRRLWIPAAAAAVLALLWVAPRAMREDAAPVFREEAVTTTVAPRPISPLGTVRAVSGLVWSSVPHANGYRVRLFDGNGTTLWERETSDTVTSVSDSLALRPATPYFWRVDAQTGFDRWAASDLVEFSLQRDEQ